MSISKIETTYYMERNDKKSKKMKNFDMYKITYTASDKHIVAHQEDCETDYKQIDVPCPQSNRVPTATHYFTPQYTDMQRANDAIVKLLAGMYEPDGMNTKVYNDDGICFINTNEEFNVEAEYEEEKHLLASHVEELFDRFLTTIMSCLLIAQQRKAIEAEIAGKECPVLMTPLDSKHVVKLKCNHFLSSQAWGQMKHTRNDDGTLTLNCPLCRTRHESSDIQRY